MSSKLFYLYIWFYPNIIKLLTEISNYFTEKSVTTNDFDNQNEEEET